MRSCIAPDGRKESSGILAMVSVICGSYKTDGARGVGRFGARVVFDVADVDANADADADADAVRQWRKACR